MLIAGDFWARVKSQVEAALSVSPTVRRQADNKDSNVGTVEEGTKSFREPSQLTGK